MKRELDSFLRNLQAQSYSPGTISAYRSDLAGGLFVFLRQLNIHDLASVATENIRDYSYFLTLTKRNSNFTRKRKLASIKSFFKFLVETKVLDINPVAAIKSPKLPDKKPAYLTEQECLRLINVVTRKANHKYKERDLAMIILFLHTGMRVSELINLKIQDIDFEARLAKVTRKGNKEQRINLNNEVVHGIKKYLSIRQSSNGFLFINSNGQKLNRSSIYRTVKRYLLVAGMTKHKWGPHVLRHTFCTRLHQKGVDLLVLQKLAGHRSLNTTMMYVSIEDKEQIEAVDRLELGVF